jgi:hypothetical protein
MLFKEVTKAGHGEVTHISCLFSDKSCIKVLQKVSQNCDDRLKVAFFGHCDQMRYFGSIFLEKSSKSLVIFIKVSKFETKPPLL